MAKAIKRLMCEVYGGNGTLWFCETPNFTITLKLERQYGYQYDGDDEDGETQRQLDSGALVAFNSVVLVSVKATNDVIGESHLGGSVYAPADVAQFLQSGYVRGMVNEACEQAREAIQRMPRVRVPAPAAPAEPRAESAPKLFQAEIMLCVTAYVKAETPEAAAAIVRKLDSTGVEFSNGEIAEGVAVSGVPFNSPDLPAVSISPAATIYARNMPVIRGGFITASDMQETDR